MASRRSVIFLTLMCAACAPAQTLSAASPDGRGARADAAFEALTPEGFSGSILAACGGDVIYRRDFEIDVAEGREPTYWLASLTKNMTAVAILRLAEQGRLSLDDTLSDFFPNAPEDKAGLTLFQLLSHQSGLPHDYTAEGVRDRDAAVAAILALPLEFTAGERFGYADENYVLAAAIIEIVSGETYEDFMAEMLEDAGLRSFGFWPDADETTPALAEAVPEHWLQPNWGFRGAGGLRMSVEDLHRWARALDENRVISQASRDVLLGRHVTTSRGLEVGFTWFHEIDEAGRALLWTRGYDTAGFNAVLYRIEGTPFIVTAATHSGPSEDDGPGWSRTARDVLLDIYASPGVEPCTEDGAP